jgi:hypothetical protein
MDVSGELHAPAVLPPGKNPSPLNRALCLILVSFKAQVEEKRNVYRALVGKPLGKRTILMM